MAVSYHTNRRCAYAQCSLLLVPREREDAWHFNRRRFCSKSCGGSATATTRPLVHGTQRGYQRCRLREEGACDECKAAQAAYSRGVTARDRAARRLIEKYPDDYQLMLEQEQSDLRVN